MKNLEAHPWVARIASHRFLRTQVQLAFGRDLFSSAGVDVGTTRLLRVLEKSACLRGAAPDRPLAILDLGCGVGSLGLSIAAGLEPGAARVVLVDRDRLAVDLARENARANGLDDRVSVLDAGLDFAPCRAAQTGPFDLIVSNVPAKVGRGGLAHLLFGAGNLLRPGGRVAFVHVAPLTEMIDEARADFEEGGGSLEFEFGSRGAEHVARVWRFPDGLPPSEAADGGDPLRPYLRDDVSPRLTVSGLPAFEGHVAVHDVPEFDTPHFQVGLLADLIERDVHADDLPEGEDILVMNPAHGFLALRLAQRRPRSIGLLSRDTLELEVARRNLERFVEREGLATRVEIPAPHPRWPWLPAPFARYDRIAGGIVWKEGQAGLEATLRALGAALVPHGKLAVAVGTGQLQTLLRVARSAGLRGKRNLRKSGVAAVLLRPRSGADDDVVDLLEEPEPEEFDAEA